MEFDRLAVPDLHKQLRDQDRRRHLDPDAPDLKALGLPRVVVAYRWNPRTRVWVMLGFARAQKLTKRTIARLRRKFDVSPRTIMQVVDLFEAQRRGGPVGAPKIEKRPAEVEYLTPIKST